MHRCYKPLPNGWFIVVFTTLQVFWAIAHPHHIPIIPNSAPCRTRGTLGTCSAQPVGVHGYDTYWYLDIWMGLKMGTTKNGNLVYIYGKMKINQRHLGVHYVQIDPYLVSYIIYLPTLVEHWTHLNASRILRIECAFSGQWSNKQRPNLVVIPSTQHIIKMLSCGSWNSDLLGPTCCMCGVKHNPHHRNRKSNWWSRKKKVGRS